MVRKSRLRLDALKASSYEEDLTTRPGSGDGICSKLAAVASGILGIVVLVSSFLLLRNERLQAHLYWNPYSSLSSKTFPAVLLGSAATNTASSILQVIGSLMLLFQDISHSIWKWLNFTVFMISAMSILLLEKENYSDFPLYHFHLVALIINCISCAIFLICNILCAKSNR